MKQTSMIDIISPVMVGPSSSHTAGAIRLGLLAKNIYNEVPDKVTFKLYNSFAQTGKGHGTDKGLLSGVLGLNVDDIRIKDIFNSELAKEFEYEFLTGKYNTLLLIYKDVPNMISRVTNSIHVNIASFHCDRYAKGEEASMCICLDGEINQKIIDFLYLIEDVYMIRYIKKLES